MSQLNQARTLILVNTYCTTLAISASISQTWSPHQALQLIFWLIFAMLAFLAFNVYQLLSMCLVADKDRYCECNT